MTEFRKNQPIVFFQGRRPAKGIVEEVQGDGRVVVQVKTNGGVSRQLMDPDEIRPVEDIQGKRAKIRFL